MRQAGTIPTKQDADRFADYLLSLGISSKVEGSNSEWAIWVHDENQVSRTRDELATFQREPQDPRYQAAEQTAKQVRREEAERIRTARKNYVDLRNQWASPWRRRPVTTALIAASVLVTMLPFDHDVLLFSNVAGSLAQIASGQVWRLVTPIFLHFGLLHLLFNMWWLYDLGTLIEGRLGSLRYALLVLAITIPSNYLQFAMSSAAFGGMSGVVYGLFGYAWVRGRLDPTCGLYLRPDVPFWLMAYFVLCIIVPGLHVANWAHGGGLAMGAALGWASYTAHEMRRKR